ncbi:hypothetical protein T05_4881 [Trichinella murrelli]|uniref:Uncharacterized protein n=1 Tax=Trichinella murrelli TaxID=144512 RepID=A0A0V0U323_9BILA|nr:hypothetical protein T05_4881 [Trichinella murrelli]
MIREKLSPPGGESAREINDANDRAAKPKSIIKFMTRHRRLMNKRRRREYHQRRNPTGIASQSSLLHHLHAHTVLFFEYEDISTYNNFQLANFEDQKNADTDACQSFMST